jgi:hypothetical protein
MENENKKVEDYIEDEQEQEDGHVNTRCYDCCSSPDPSLGCDLGIDVAG